MGIQNIRAASWAADEAANVRWLHVHGPSLVQSAYLCSVLRFRDARMFMAREQLELIWYS